MTRFTLSRDAQEVRVRLSPALFKGCPRGLDSPEERQYRAQLHEVPAEDRDPARTRVTLIAPALLVLYGMVMPFLLLHFYVKPYQRGSATIRTGDALNWSEIEPWIAFGPAVVFIPLGLLAGVTIWRRYRPPDNATG